jgi:hypothetical protein
MAHALLGQWPFGKSKLDLKQSSLRRVRSSNLKLASWRAELVQYRTLVWINYLLHRIIPDTLSLNEKKREAREDRVNFRSAWRPAGMSRHIQQRSVEEGRSLLGGTHAMKSVKPSVDIFEGL